MAKVPYSPVPDTPAQSIAAPMLNLNVNADAFGGNIGEAMQGLSRTLETAGNRLFSEAVQLRKDEMETNVNEAVTKSLMQTGDLDNKFRLTEGKDPQENLETHKNALVASRESIRNELKTDFERKMYDKETMRRLGYDIVNASNYSATQMKQYNRQSKEATQMTIADRAARDPYNEAYIDEAIKSTTEIETGVSVGLGESAPMTQMRIDKKVGQLIGNVAVARAVRDPDGAMAFLNKYKEKLPNGGVMPAEVYQAALEKVNDRKIKYHATLDSRTLSGGTQLPARHVVTQNAPAIQAIADKAGWGPGSTFTPENIYRLVHQESKGQNLPPNKHGYAGYFQMRPSEFGMTPNDFKNMSFEQQLELYAGSYLKKHGYTGTQDLGVMNAAPAFKNAPDTQIAYAAGSDEAIANPAWVRASAAGGAVTVGGIKAWAEQGGAGITRLPETSLPEVAARAAELAKERFKDDPISQERYLEQLLSNSQRNAHLMRSQLNQQKQANRNAIDEVLYRVGPGDRGPTSWEDAERLRPGFMNLVEEASKTNPTIAKHVNDTFVYNAKQDVEPTKERFDRYQEYLGLSYGLNPGDREKFLSANPATLDLTREWTGAIQKKQLEIQKGLRDTSKLREAMHTMGPLLTEAKIFSDRSSPSKTAVYNTFMGGYLQKLQEFEIKEKRFPNEQEQIAIGSPIIRKLEGSWDPRIWTKPRFEFMPPPEKATEIKRDFLSRWGREPNSMEIGQVYQRLQSQEKNK